ncbi:glycosyltransferase [Glycomyces xiaoerkulensis]|uniref:glycosyltransferase n=1 Tax=Glycomyces xiaoerkulensis TaxID=2038139 RepID=UPI000C266B49|nr:glycosyltransferase [Glycomyces xiaoerkulensis]
MKIAMVSEHASPIADMGGEDGGGQNIHVARLAAALARQGHEVAVYTRRDDPRLAERVRAPGDYEVVHVDAGPADRIGKDHLLPFMGDFAYGLLRLWETDRPDIVHAHFWMSGLASLWAAERCDVPVVETYHALGTVKRRHQGGADASPPGRTGFEADVGDRCAGIIATSEEEVRELAAMGVSEDKIALIPCGVDLDLFNPVGEADDLGSRYQILTAGRLVPRKGFATIIRAMKHLPHTELVIAGGPVDGQVWDDPEGRRLRDIALAEGVSGRVRMPGQIPNDRMPAQYRAADVVVCAPWYEPFGIVPLEAMACGVPVVAAAVGGLKDTVEDGVSGTLVDDPTPESIAAAVQTYLEEGDVRRVTGQAGRLRTCARYSWDAIAAETWKSYELAVSAA